MPMFEQSNVKFYFLVSRGIYMGMKEKIFRYLQKTVA